MMKALKILMLQLFLLSVTANGQNLVVNPSFEDTVSCPSTDGQVFLCVGWDGLGSSDYFNSCSFNFSVPNNWGGYQPASSGNAYAAIGTYGDTAFGYSCNDSSFCDSREYIGQWLSAPLTVGTKYYITIKTSLSISNTIYSNCATNNLGLLFSMSQPSFGIPNPTLIRNFAHVVCPTMITDSSGWTTISGTFIADSAYQYITIGNFFDDPNTNTQIMDANSYCNAYYFIDDVCVSSDSATCFSPVGIVEPISEHAINIYPNPASNQIHIDLQSNAGNSTALLFNVQGQLIRKILLGGSSATILNVQGWPNGIYLLQVSIDNSIYQQKLIINH